MKAVSINKPGSAAELIIEKREKPTPQNGELLIKVKATAINRTDIMKRENQQLQSPYPILGVEMAGVVEENNSSNTEFALGTRVASLVNNGSYAEYVTIPAERVIHLPDEISFEEGTAIPEVFLTAYQTLYWLGKLQQDETVLIHAGGSGVGTAAIQLAKQLTDAKVITTAGSAEKLDFCKQLGADETINYKTEDFSERVLEITDGEGVELILDFVGASYWEKNFKSIKVDGRWILIGTLGGSVVENVNIGSLLGKRVTLKATVLTPRSDGYKAELTREFVEKVLPLFKAGKIHPIIDRVFPFEEVAEAHRYMEDNKNTGKIILSLEKEDNRA
ncbi:NAD(P)H-quinone oxidoreductase [Desemzia sp. RIT804]|uniref:NAD(P)H-quinone oxidoreductase n=1 Tax=Desemzia sp. RIT 804 TaxID=2810209 RepID=UPI0019502BC2|nr:NAD(P)H-quinone oxidoreductase [Desemzia sp. RIT 804]MBM6616000.1 NAD(P)H-quinone oxidoreductase [Desemzia sp. RIT 804]